MYAKLKVSDNCFVQVFNTHTIAQYTPIDEDDQYRADRLTQIFELARLVKTMTSNLQDHFTLVMGDLNCTPGSLEFHLLSKVLGSSFRDVYIDFTKDRSESELAKNHDNTIEGEAKRLDYIFYQRQENWSLSNSEITMKDDKIIISDHYGVSATFQFNFRNNRSDTKIETSSLNRNNMEKGLFVILGNIISLLNCL